MAELLAAIVAFPAVIPTVLLGVALLYWMLVMFGAVDIDLFSADGAADGVLDGAAEGASHGLLDGAADGAADGVLDGVAHGAADGVLDGVAHGAADGVLDGVAHGAADGVFDGVADGAADGVLDGVADGAADGVLDGVADGAADGVIDGAADGAAHAMVHVDHAGHALTHGGPDGALDGAGEAAAGHGSSVASLLSLANFRSVPVTVMLSVLVAFTWLLCVMGVGFLPVGLGGVPGWILGSLILVGAFVLSLPPTAVVIRPMAQFFVVHDAKSHKDMVGRICQVTTGSVGVKFGQAHLVAGDLDLIVQVRHDKEGTLKRGDRALILAWDQKREAFLVEPYDKLIGSGDG